MSKYQKKMELLRFHYVRKGKRNQSTMEDIKQMENELSYTLPTDYVDFLLNYGGCAFSDVTYPLIDPCPIGDRQLLSICFGILPGDTYDLINNYHTFKERIPPNFLPIACDGMGNLVCLSINGNDKGNVYFWQHDAEELIDDNEHQGYAEDIYLAAKSFDEFIDSLEIYIDDEEEEDE